MKPDSTEKYGLKYGISDNKKFPAVFRKTNMRNACNIHSKKERKKKESVKYNKTELKIRRGFISVFP